MANRRTRPTRCAARSASACTLAMIVLVVVAVSPPLDTAAASAGPGRHDPGDGAFVLSATNPLADYAPPFTGNGELGIRVPPAGQGYAGGSVPTDAELAGLYAQPTGGVQQR